MSARKTTAVVLGITATMLVLALLVRAVGPDSHDDEAYDVAEAVEAEAAVLRGTRTPASEPLGEEDTAPTTRPAGGGVELRVVEDEGGKPLEGVSVLVLSENHHVVQRRKTGVDGLATLEPPQGGLQLLLRKAGFVPRRSALATLVASAAPTGPAELRLRRGRMMRGRVVVGRDRSVPREPIRVLAWPQAQGFPSRAAFVAALAGSDSVLVTATDAHGEFVFEEIEPQARYWIFAAGGGYIDPGSPRQVTQSEAEVLIRVDPLYVLQVRLLDQEGNPVPEFGPMQPVPTPTLNLGGSGFKPNLTGKFADHLAMLAGIALPDGNAMGGALWGTAEVDEHRVGPGLAIIRYPGFHQTKARIWAYRASPDNLVVNEVRLRAADAVEYGSVVYRLADPGLSDQAKAASAAAVPEPFGAVRLVMQDPPPGGLTTFAAPLHRASFDEVLVSKLPAGRYKGQLISVRTLGFYRTEDIQFEVFPGKRTSIVFSPKDWAVVEFSIPEEARGRRSAASVKLEWQETQGENPGPRETTFDVPVAAPLRIEGIAAREYQLTWEIDGVSYGPRRVRVKSGQLHELQLTRTGE